MANNSYTPTNPQNQGTFLNTVTFPELVDLVNRNFETVGGLIVPVAKQLYITESMGANEGELKLIQEFDYTTYAKAKPQGVDAKKAAFGIGYYITVRVKRIGIESEITFEMRRFNKKTEVMAAITALPHFCPQRVELDLTHRFTFATSTAYTDMDGNSIDLTVGDGLALASSSHTLKFSSTTYSNRVTGDPLFSKGALEAAELLTTTDILSNFGERRVMDFNRIVTGNNPTVVNAVKQFLRSTSDNTQNNPGVVNVNQDKYQHVILSQLATTATGANDSTKKNWWSLMAVGAGLRGLQAYFIEWEPANMIPSTSGNGQDVHKDIWYFNVRQSYNVGIVSGRGAIFSCPVS
jgi:hypothetical protein